MAEYDDCTDPMCLKVGEHQIPEECKFVRHCEQCLTAAAYLLPEYRADRAWWDQDGAYNETLTVFGRQSGKQHFAGTAERFVRTYYAPGQVIEIRLPKRLTDPPVVVQQYDQRAEDRTYENEFGLSNETEPH